MFFSFFRFAASIFCFIFCYFVSLFMLFAGTQDVVIKGFSEHVDPNSLRVSAGKLKLSIVEVNACAFFCSSLFLL